MELAAGPSDVAGKAERLSRADPLNFMGKLPECAAMMSNHKVLSIHVRYPLCTFVGFNVTVE